MLFFVNTVVVAVEVKNLYTGKILVLDKTQATRVKAHKWAIEQVLTKVTGSREILSNKTVSYEIRTRTANYIKSFSFKTDDQGRTFLVDEFDQEKIDGLIRRVGASIWGQRRPLTSIWMVMEEGINRNIVSEELNPQLYEVITQSAEDRGLPVLMPSLDALDKAAVYPSDIWARFENVVYQANQRYQTDHFVMARLRHVDNFKEPEYVTGWLLEFSLFNGKQYLYQSSINGEQFAVLKEMVNELGDFFAKKYAIQNEQIQQEFLNISVTGIQDIVQFKKVENYLKELPPVKKSELLMVQGNEVKYKLWLSGQALDVVKALSLLPDFEKLAAQQKPKKELSVSEQLELLTEEYKALQKGVTPKPESKADSLQNLRYMWVGQ